MEPIFATLLLVIGLAALGYFLYFVFRSGIAHVDFGWVALAVFAILTLWWFP